MKKLSYLVLFLFNLQTCLPVFAASSEVPPTENLISKEYGKLLIDDARDVLNAPFRWNQEDWLWAGLGTGTVVAMAVFADESIQEDLGHRNKTNDRLARFYGPFGYEHVPIFLGVFEAGGLLFHDDRARQVAHDGIASSLIATGLITGSLKFAAGRTRPFDEEGAHHFSPFSGDDSFPSGHTTEAFALATVVSEHYDAFWIKTLSYGTATMVGYSRMETGSHWASDALAGAFIGIAVGKAVVRFNKKRRYELSFIAGEDITGVKAVRTF